jgi:nitroimidazol reductase NimA-like FMN-containing flavoprotein (pyridoxamine 5'-phosphate oxidase superfamily)
MLIQEITKQDSFNRLANMRLGRLACAQGAQPYILPFYFAYDSNYLYSFSTVGKKIEWMRVNPLVCVETDEVMSSEEWVSIIIFGRYEELPNTLEWEAERARAHELLQRKAIWWEPGYVKTIVQGAERQLVPVYFRIYIEQITGHQGSSGRA